eukprot:UN33178
MVQDLSKDLADAYQLIAYFGWTDSIYQHLTVQIPGCNSFLMNPYGLEFEEINADDLIEVSFDGTVIDPGTSRTAGKVNPSGMKLHSQIHRARPDSPVIFHMHNSDISAVGATEEGFLPVDQYYFSLPPIIYHDFYGLSAWDDKLEEVIKSDMKAR